VTFTVQLFMLFCAQWRLKDIILPLPRAVVVMLQRETGDLLSRASVSASSSLTYLCLWNRQVR